MQRINTPTAQPDLYGTGKPGFRDGNKASGISATALDAAFFNALQEELCNMIEAFVALNLTSKTQLRDVLLANFAQLSGATFTGSALGNSATGRQIAGYWWSDMSSNGNGFALFGNNCYFNRTDNTYRYSCAHGSLGARGLVMVPGSGLRWFDMGTVATTANAAFTPTLVAMPTTWASSAEAQGLVAVDRLLSPATLEAAFKGTNQTLSASALNQRIPGGVIIKVGSISAAARSTEYDFGTQVFPIAFPNTCVAVVVQIVTQEILGLQDCFSQVRSVTAASFQALADSLSLSTRTYGINWIAIGY